MSLSPDIRKVTCGVCRNFAWSDGMEPVEGLSGALHHPSCRHAGKPVMPLVGQPGCAKCGRLFFDSNPGVRFCQGCGGARGPR